VQREIHNFGGDPTKVAIFGQSSGAEGVELMTVLPASKGLFRGAISQARDSRSLRNRSALLRQQLGMPMFPLRHLSLPEPFTILTFTYLATIACTLALTGHCLHRYLQSGGIDARPLANALKGTVELGRRLGCDAEEELYACLQRAPADKLIKAQDQGDVGPVVDGILVPARPSQLLAEGKQLDVAIMWGCNTNDSNLQIHEEYIGQKIGREKYIQILQDSLPGGVNQSAYLKRALELYPPAPDVSLACLRVCMRVLAPESYRLAASFTLLLLPLTPYPSSPLPPPSLSSSLYSTPDPS